MQESFFKFFSTAGALFQDFLQFKSGGKQIDDVKSHIQPTIEMRDFMYPPTSTNAAGVTGFVSASTGQKFPLHGGAGIYRIRGTCSASGLTGGSAGTTTLILTAVLNSTQVMARTTLFRRYVPATTAYDITMNDFDFMFDCRTDDPSTRPDYFAIDYLEINSSDAATVCSWSIVAQRVI